eukprot:scaffold14441_cov83-Skeletonema_dohrnii-CCMP3373.AAC.2
MAQFLAQILFNGLNGWKRASWCFWPIEFCPDSDTVELISILACCAAQKNRCLTACANNDPFDKNDCLLSCLASRDCDFETSDVTCNDLKPFPTRPDNTNVKKCGTPAQGGAKCKGTCCRAQMNYCGGCLFPCDAICLLTCLEDRNC